ncbi:MAG TPA: PQQ-binding-like beta-propeller repeat protein [Planctomycetaceae bacterium]
MLVCPQLSPAADELDKDGDSGPYPLGLSLRLLERDLSSKDYAVVLETMIPTDLEAEWKRVATADNHETFLAQHGGKQKVVADPVLKAAWERRVKIADGFLDLMRSAYKKRNITPPFDKGEKIDFLGAGAAARAAKDQPVVAVRVVLPAPGAERQWPRLRGPTGQGTALESNFPPTWSETENIVWKAEIPGRGHGSPIIWDQRLFITSASEDGQERWLLCYDRGTGSLLWQKAAPKPATQEKLYWKNSYASTTPVTDGQRVIAFFGNSGLVSFDFEGNQLWHQDLGTFPTMHGPGASPVLYQDRVFVVQDQTQGKSVFAAFDKNTGAKIWQHERPQAACWTTPTMLHVGDRDELVVNGSHTITAYRPETGEPIWSLAGSSRESIPMIVVGCGLIYSTSGRNGPMIAIRPGGTGNVTETHIAWQLPRGGPHVPSPAYYEGRLYLVNDTGIASCLACRTGETIWQTRLPGRFSMSPIEAGRKLLFTSETGTTYVLLPGPEFKLMATNELGEDVLATPAVLGGRIYFRTKGHLVCVGKNVTGQ